MYCSTHHQGKCLGCCRALTVAELSLTEGYMHLSHGFAIVAPNVKYASEKARRRLLQMPLLSICVGDATKGMSFTIIMEYCHGVDYSHISSVINKMAQTSQN